MEMLRLRNPPNQTRPHRALTSYSPQTAPMAGERTLQTFGQDGQISGSRPMPDSQHLARILRLQSALLPFAGGANSGADRMRSLQTIRTFSIATNPDAKNPEFRANNRSPHQTDKM